MSDDSIPAKMLALRKRIEDEEGVLTVTMKEVRDAYGSERLGVNVREGIHDLLDQLGIGHYPRSLPAYQDQPVRLYHRSSPVGKLIKAVLNPSEANDDVLRRAAQGDAAKVIQKIKELVGR